MADTFDYDVFLSHNRADKDWVRQLAARIERETWNGKPLKVFFDEWDIQPGDNIPIALENALPKSRKIALVMSPDFFKSEWTETERAGATILSPANRAKRTIPLFLRDCEIPLLLSELKYIDFRDASKFEASFKQLMAFLREEPLPRGGTAETFAEPAMSLPNAPIPHEPLIGFIARRDKEGHDLVEYVGELLMHDNAFVALWGEGGIGKTILAAEIARQHSEVAWVSADGHPNFSFGAFLDATVTQLGQADVRTLAPEKKIERTHELLADVKPLLVLDNFETIPNTEQMTLAEFLSNVPCAVSVTSRDKVPYARNIPIYAMGDGEAHEFVRKLIAVAPRRDVFAGIDIAQVILNAAANPLVMEWIVAQIDDSREPNRVFDELEHGQGDAAQRVFDRSFNLLADDARAALLALTLFVPNATRGALGEVADLYSTQIDKIITRLVSLRLAETDALNHRISVVGLTRTLANARFESDRRRRRWKRRFVHYLVRYAESYAQTTSKDLDALETDRENLFAAMNIAFVTEDLQSMKRVADVITAYLRKLGVIAQAQGDYATAQKRYVESLDIAKKLGDQNSIADTLSQLGDIAYRLGDFETAEQRYVESLESFKKLGVQAQQATVLYQFANIAYWRGDYETARARYAESLEINKKLGNQSSIASTLYQLSIMARDIGDLETAWARCSESFEIFKKLNDQNGIAITLHTLGTIAQRQGDYATAQQRYSESLSIEKKLGNQRGIANTLHQLGMIAQDQGDYETARARYAESLDIAKQLSNQSGIASTLHQLGMLAEIAGDKIEAARLFREALGIFERLKSPNAKIARESLERVTQKKEGTRSEQ